MGIEGTLGDEDKLFNENLHFNCYSKYGMDTSSSHVQLIVAGPD